MANPGLTKTMDASGAIKPFRIVAHGTNDFEVKQASDKTQPLLGTTDEVGRTPSGEVDVALSDMPDVEFGGSVAAGDPLTTDADGRAIKATVSGSRIVGFAHTSAAAGVIGPYNHALGILP